MNKQDIPDRLFHGTSAHRYASILTRGILPREQVGAKSWHGKYESRGDAVYLTSAYPLFFAQVADENAADDHVIIEIDTTLLDHTLLVADEDVLDFWARSYAKDCVSYEGLSSATKFVLEDKKAMMQCVTAERSLRAMGTCAYLGPIPREALTRAVRINIESVCRLVRAGMDPVVSPAAYAVMGAEHEEATRWLFDPTGPKGSLVEGFSHSRHGLKLELLR